jgi:hypothetical protein
MYHDMVIIPADFFEQFKKKQEGNSLLHKTSAGTIAMEL